MSEPGEVRLPGVMWHVTVTLHGQPQEPGELARQLSQLALAHGIGLSARYQPDMVELRYWDEGHDCGRVAGNALGLWDSHREDLGLPSWAVVGLEVLDRGCFRRRYPRGTHGVEPFTPGVRPLSGESRP